MKQSGKADLDPKTEDPATLADLLKELRAIRALLENPKATAISETRRTVTT